MRYLSLLLIPMFGAWMWALQNGTYQGASSCQGCHSNENIGGIQYTQWAETAHASAYDSASAFVRNTAQCLECHTTGWDTTMANLGADDFVTINADGSVAVDNQAEFDKKVNVQCESCHGPTGDGNHPPQTNPATAATCGTCHQDGHHPFVEEWEMSAHAGSTTHPVAGLQDRFRNDPACSGCHTYQGFVEFVGTTPEDSTNIEPNVTGNYGDDALPITCATCHDPHSAKHESQLRLAVGDLCVKCHNAEGAEPPDTPHHAMGDMWDGSGAVEFAGFTYRNQSVHQFVAAEKKCATCHVFMSDFQSEVIPAQVGHTFAPRVAACGQAGCHAGSVTRILTAEEDTAYFNEDVLGAFSAFDYKGRQSYTDSLMAVLDALLENALATDPTVGDSLSYQQALFNYQFVDVSGSRGVHNPSYAEDILTSTIAFVRDNLVLTAVEPVADADLPARFELSQNYPNPFNPVTTIRFDVPQATHVNLTVYNVAGQVVETLVNEELTPSTYRVQFEADGLSSGIYLYTLRAGDVTMSKTMILLK